MSVRDHEGTVIDTFNGLWQRGDVDSVPSDHFTDCENIKFIASTSFGTRDGIGISQDVAVPLEDVKRIYNYPTQTANTLLVLTYTAGVGTIYHVVNATTVYGPILTVTGMIDFGFVPYAGRAYLTPFGTFVTGDLNIEKGLDNEFVYVYLGAGVVARKAAGNPLSGTPIAAVGVGTGHIDAGFHVYGFVAETDTGYLTAPSAFVPFHTTGTQKVSFSTIPVGGASVVKRHLVATKAFPGPYDGNTTGHTFYFVPNGTINDNTTTVLNNIDYYDADLIDDASHLLDNYAEIPAVVGLMMYHNRMVAYTSFDDINLCIVSAIGEPEAISQVDGLIVVPPDGNPLTNAQELRDVLYVFKRSRTVAFVDNGDVPSSWPMTFIDNALGTCVHGIATVLDSGSATVDLLIIGNYNGISLFNGAFITPELSWKIESFWKALERNDFRLIQMVNAPVQKEIYITLPDRRLLAGNYANGMNAKNIRWCPWTYQMGVNTVAIVNIDEIILGADLVV